MTDPIQFLTETRLTCTVRVPIFSNHPPSISAVTHKKSKSGDRALVQYRSIKERKTVVVLIFSFLSIAALGTAQLTEISGINKF